MTRPNSTYHQEVQKTFGLCIVYFKRYDMYQDTHEAIIDIYQRYILFGFRQKRLDISTNFMEIWVF